MKYKIGIIGLGRAGMNHLLGCRNIHQVSLAAICDNDHDRLKKIGAEYNIEKKYLKVQEMLSNEDLDITIIAVPPKFHKENLELAMKYSQHILIEKPLAISLEEANECISMSKGYKKKIMVNENFRWTPDFSVVTDFLEKGFIGEPYWIKVELLRRAIEDPTKSKWLYNESFRWLSEDGIHWFDLFNFWLKVKATKVFAHLPKLPFSVEQKGDIFDIVHTVYENDRSATLIQHFASMGFKPIEQGGKNKTEIRIEGTEGAINTTWGDKIPMSTKDVCVEIISQRHGGLLYPYIEDIGNYWAGLNEIVIKYFIECIDKDLKPSVTMEEEKKALEILYAAYESSEIGQVVSLK